MVGSYVWFCCVVVLGGVCCCNGVVCCCVGFGLNCWFRLLICFEISGGDVCFC